jgi:hypothetical protein
MRLLERLLCLARMILTFSCQTPSQHFFDDGLLKLEVHPSSHVDGRRGPYSAIRSLDERRPLLLRRKRVTLDGVLPEFLIAEGEVNAPC